MPNERAGRSSRRSTRGPGRPSGSNRSAIETPSASAIRRSEAMLALDRPRSTWLRKLSLRPDRSAIVRRVQRRNRRSARSRSPTSTSAATSGALDGIPNSPSDPVEGKLTRPYGFGEVASISVAQVKLRLTERQQLAHRRRERTTDDGAGARVDDDHGPGRVVGEQIEVAAGTCHVGGPRQA